MTIEKDKNKLQLKKDNCESAGNIIINRRKVPRPWTSQLLLHYYKYISRDQGQLEYFITDGLQLSFTHTSVRNLIAPRPSLSYTLKQEWLPQKSY